MYPGPPLNTVPCLPVHTDSEPIIAHHDPWAHADQLDRQGLALILARKSSREIKAVMHVNGLGHVSGWDMISILCPLWMYSQTPLHIGVVILELSRWIASS